EALGDREVAAPGAEIGEGGLHVNRRRIVDPARDPGVRQPLPDRFAVRDQRRIDVIDVPALLPREGQLPPGPGQQFGIALRMRPARPRPAVEAAELHLEHGTLDRVHPVVVPAQDVVVLAVLAPVAEAPRRRGDRRVVRDQSTALAAGAETLAGIEAEAADMADGAGALTV